MTTLTDVEKQQGYQSKLPGRSSLNELKVVPGSKAFRYDVEIGFDKNGVWKDLTKQSDVLSRAAVKETCQVIIEHLYGQTAKFGCDELRYVYDGRRTLYTNQPIKSNVKLTNIAVLKEALPEIHRTFIKADEISVAITPNDRSHVVDYSDWNSAAATNPDDVVDQSARQFLDILTSQYFLNLVDGDRRLYQTVSSGSVFEKANQGQLVPGVNYCTGMRKGIKIISPEKGFIVIDAKRSAFYADKLVSEILSDFMAERNLKAFDAARRMKAVLRDVRCTVVYRPTASIVFADVTDRNIGTFKADDRLSIPDYLKERYGFNVDPNRPGVIALCPGRTKKAIYPVEALRVISGQIMTMDSMDRISHGIANKLLLENSVVPATRYGIATQFMKALGIVGKEFLSAWGVNIVGMNSVSIKTRKLPTLRMGGGLNNVKTSAVEPGNFSIQQLKEKVLIPAKTLETNRWMVVRSDIVSASIEREFMELLLRHASEVGIGLSPPIRKSISHGNWKNDLSEQFQFASSQNVKYMFFLDDKRTKSHARLKLLESVTGVLTQHVTTFTSLKGQFMRNIVWKMNAKASGVNYLPNFEGVEPFDITKSNEVLIIGYDVAHPDANKSIKDLKSTFQLKEKMNEGRPEEEKVYSVHPSVVGIAANKLKMKGTFGGDFFYQDSRRESVDPQRFQKAVAELVEQFCTMGGNPRRIIALRDGVSEGQYAMVARDENPALLRGIREGMSRKDIADVNAPIEVLHLIVTKNHNKRIYRAAVGKDGKDTVFNTTVGDVVNTDIVQPQMREFYLQTHLGIKGVPKMSQYCAPINNMNISQDKIETLMMNLAFMHQICASPTSLPTPVYVAHETAKRGSDLYNEFRQLYKDRSDPLHYLTASVNIVGSADGENLLDYDELTKHLGYSEKSLRNVRYNA